MNIRRWIQLSVSCTLLSYLETTNAQSTVVRVETVSDYTFVCPGGSSSCNTDANVEGAGFYSGMTGAGSTWVGGSFYKDGSVWDRDFYDPQLTGVGTDNDAWSDQAGTGISLYIGHGFCDDMTVTGCTSDANCPSGSYCPGGNLIPGTQHVCIQQTARIFQTSSASSLHGNIVTYGQNFGQPAALSIAWGEDSASGSWGGAGTNGGTNVAILLNSCGFRSRLLAAETSNMFAGIHSLLVAVPTSALGYTGSFGTLAYSDASQWAERGANLAAIIQANLNAPVGDAWLNGTLLAHGFTGLNGAPPEGANMILSKDTTLSAVQFHANLETWNQAKQESFDGHGLGFFWFRYACNYSCNTLGL